MIQRKSWPTHLFLRGFTHRQFGQRHACGPGEMHLIQTHWTLSDADHQLGLPTENNNNNNTKWPSVN